MLDASLNEGTMHRHGIYKNGLIYVQTRVKDQGSPGNGKIENDILQFFFMLLVQMNMNVFMNDFAFDRYEICWRL